GDGADRDRLVEMALQLQPALIVVDSLSSISSKGENNVEDVRELLGFLNQLALDAQCGLLLVHHLRKRAPLPMMDTLTVDDFRGSSHIIAMSRSVMGLSIVQTGPEPDRNGPRRLEIVKTNLARYPEPIGVHFVPMHPKGVLIQYTAQPPQAYKQPTKTDECSEWQLRILEEAGPLKPQEIVERAEAEGFSQRTVYRSREKLGGQIVDTDGHKHPENRWALA
ncbi:MAG TPA: AAA family ATPase, partial [Anaerolineae bacterium]|nr:AAA family ATPase [Anaerolineae bacterium]